VNKQENFQLGFFARVAQRFLTGYAAPILVLIATCLGVAALWLTPQEEEPQIIVPFADVFVDFPGASAWEVENLVAQPLERLLWQIDGVEYVYSVSQPDRAVVSVRFFVGEDRERSLVKLYNKINSNIDLVPPGVTGWVIKPVEIDDVPIVSLTLHSPSYDDYALYRIAHELRVRLDTVSDLSLLRVIGGRPLETRVDLKPEALKAHSISSQEVAAALKAANWARQSGHYDQGNQRYELRSGPFLVSADDASELVVGVFDQRPVYLRDLAKIETGPAEPLSYSRITFGEASDRAGEESQHAVTLAAAKKKGTNGVSVAEQLLAKVEELRGFVIPHDVYVTVTRNTGKTAEEKVTGLLSSLFLAIAIVVTLLLFFLGWRAGLIVALSIPITFALALFTNYAFGFTINRVTLFALILTLGLVVDNPITAIDNIWRQLLTTNRTAHKTIIFAIQEIIVPVVMATLAIIVSFLPMFFITGMMGPYMQPMAFNVPLAVIFSTVSALTVVPWTAYHLLARSAISERGTQSAVHPLVEHVYRSILGPFLKSRKMRQVLLIALGLGLLISVVLVVTRQVPLKMLPYDNKDELQILVDLPEGSTLEQTDAVVRRFESYLSQHPDVLNAVSYVGTYSPIDFNGMIRHYYLRRAAHQADIRVNLRPKAQRNLQSHGVALSLRKDVERLARETNAKTAIVEVSPGPPVLSTIVVEVYGALDTPYVDLVQAASEVGQELGTVDGVVDVDIMTETPHQRKVYTVDKTKAALHHIDTRAIVQTLTLGLKGEVSTSLHDEVERVPHLIRLGLSREDRSGVHELGRLGVKGDSGSLISLDELGGFEDEWVESSIYHKNLERVVYVIAEVAGRSPSDIVLGSSEAVDARLAKGMYAQWAGEGEWFITLRVFRDLGIAFGVAMIAIYALLVLQTRSLVMPLIIMLAIPLTVIGVIPGFWILNLMTKEVVGGFEDPVFFTATAMIGMIALGGIVIRNSVVLIEFIEQSRREGIELNEALLQSGSVRLRPILLTALTTALGVWPITMDPVFSGLAWSLIFGLLFSTCFTLILIPVAYQTFAKRLRREDLPSDSALDLSNS